MRDRGYYWVSRGDDVWEVALWDGDAWYLCGYEVPIDDDGTLAIAERVVRDPA